MLARVGILFFIVSEIKWLVNIYSQLELHTGKQRGHAEEYAMHAGEGGASQGLPALAPPSHRSCLHRLLQSLESPISSL